MVDGLWPVARSAARVVVLDPDDRVLLIHCVDDIRGSAWWDTPGGGLWDGETHQRAARRELIEETGLREFELGPWVWTHHDAFEVRGTLFHQDERFFVVRVGYFEADGSGLEPNERELIRAFRWWTLADLEATSDELSPHNLPVLVGALLRVGPPAVPIDVWSSARAAWRPGPSVTAPLV